MSRRPAPILRLGFPAHADQVADHIKGVVAAGVWWPVQLPEGTNFSASLALSGTTSQTVDLIAASPGAVRAMVPTMVAGSPLSTYENDTAQHVAMLDSTTAATIGISPARLPSHPAVFVNGIAYTVVGIYSSAQRVISGSSGMLIPEKTALADYGNPQPGIGTQEEAQMVVATRTGAAQAVARQIAAAELPTDPHRLVVTAPPNPLKLQGEVNGDLAGLFLILALISLLIGAVGIANTTLVAVLERTGEIGVRRAVGARPRHIAAQFLAESTALGTLGGLIGTCIGVGIVVIFAAVQELDRPAEPGLHPARPPHRQRRRPARRRLPGTARGTDQPAGGPADHVTAARPLPWHDRKGTMMRPHTGRRPLLRRAALVSCAAATSCAILAACTATPKGPDTQVTAPAVGRPPAPASAQAALSSEAFTPYAGLGAVNNDGLAPGDTYDALHTACMNDAGYGQYASQALYSVRTNSGFTFALPYGWQGYIGTALAAQQGFLAGTPLAPGNGGAAGAPGQPGAPFAGLPAGAQAAAGKCFNILENFNNAQFAHSMAIIETLNNDIGNAEVADGSIKKAMANWSACMAKDGYNTSNANTFSQQALVTLGLRPSPGK